MAQRFAGLANLTVDGTQLPVRGNLVVSPAMVERTMLVGQDRTHGFQELPRVPYIECDISLTQEVNLEDLETQVDVTVVAQCANRKQYTLGNAVCKAAFEGNTRDGQTRVRWEGLFSEEIQL